MVFIHSPKDLQNSMLLVVCLMCVAGVFLFKVNTIPSEKGECFCYVIALFLNRQIPHGLSGVWFSLYLCSAQCFVNVLQS